MPDRYRDSPLLHAHKITDGRNAVAHGLHLGAGPAGTLAPRAPADRSQRAPTSLHRWCGTCFSPISLHQGEGEMTLGRLARATATSALLGACSPGHPPSIDDASVPPGAPSSRRFKDDISYLSNEQL